MKQIKGHGLIIRKFDLEKDFESFYHIHANVEATKFYGMKPLNTMNEAGTMLNSYMKAEQEQKFMHYVISLETTQNYIGEIGLFNINWQHRRANSYCILSPDYWGQKISKQATYLLFPFIFETTILNRIQAFVDSRNYSTIKSLENIGYLKEGILCEYEFERDGFIDMIVFSMTRNRLNNILNEAAI